jgi:hypothetical protein
MSIQYLRDFTADFKARTDFTVEELASLSGGKAVPVTKSPITVSDGADFTRPGNIFDWIKNNWQLAVLGIVAIIVLIKN